MLEKASLFLEDTMDTLFKMKVDFQFHKETKNSLHFKELINEDGIERMGSIYIKKSAFAALKVRPETLSVTIESL